MASRRYTLLRSTSPVADRDCAGGLRMQPRADHGFARSYFPAWMLCAAVGIIAAVIIRQILAVAGIDEYVVAPLLTYAGLAVSATLLLWLLWFGH